MHIVLSIPGLETQIWRLAFILAIWCYSYLLQVPGLVGIPWLDAILAKALHQSVVRSVQELESATLATKRFFNEQENLERGDLQLTQANPMLSAYQRGQL